MFLRLAMSVGQRRNPEFTSELRILSSNALPLSQGDSAVSEIYYKVHMTHVLHTTKISNVNSLMFVNRIRGMESF